MKRGWLRHLGSSAALVLGVLMFLVGLSKVGEGEVSNFLVSGPIVMLGALAYRSAKQRFLGQIPSTKGRRIAEAFAMVVIVLMIALHRDLKYNLATDPANIFLIPVWALVAYAVIGFRSPKAPAPSP